MPSDGKSSHCLWQGELKIHRHSTITSQHNPINNKKTHQTWMKNKNFLVSSCYTKLFPEMMAIFNFKSTLKKKNYRELCKEHASESCFLITCL